MNNQGEELVVVRTPSTVVDEVEKQHLVQITCSMRGAHFTVGQTEVEEDGIGYIMCLGVQNVVHIYQRK